MFAGLAIAAALAAAPASAKTCPPADPVAVADTLRSMYAAAMKDDGAGMQATFAPGFYAFDGGQRFDGPGMAALVMGAHATGKTYIWTVNEPDVHFACDHARIAYVNRGSMAAGSSVIPLTWLESADLVFEGGRWRIEFFHSTRAATPPPKP